MQIHAYFLLVLEQLIDQLVAIITISAGYYQSVTIIESQ